MSDAINQHKKLAMGQPVKMAAGGPVKSLTHKGVMPAIKGQPMDPITKAKRNNGIPGYKKGGSVKGGKC